MKFQVALVMTLVLAAASTMAFAAQPAEGHAMLYGKINVAAQGNSKTATITVSNVISMHNKDLKALDGKTLTIVGPKAAEVEKYAGKEVEMAGVLKNNQTQIEPVTVIEKQAAQKTTPVHRMAAATAHKPAPASSSKAPSAVPPAPQKAPSGSSPLSKK